MAPADAGNTNAHAHAHAHIHAYTAAHGDSHSPKHDHGNRQRTADGNPGTYTHLDAQTYQEAR